MPSESNGVTLAVTLEEALEVLDLSSSRRETGQRRRKDRKGGRELERERETGAQASIAGLWRLRVTLCLRLILAFNYLNPQNYYYFIQANQVVDYFAANYKETKVDYFARDYKNRD